ERYDALIWLVKRFFRLLLLEGRALTPKRPRRRASRSPPPRRPAPPLLRPGLRASPRIRLLRRDESLERFQLSSVSTVPFVGQGVKHELNRPLASRLSRLDPPDGTFQSHHPEGDSKPHWKASDAQMISRRERDVP